MIIEINSKDLSILDNSFLSIEDIKKEFINNPFARYIIYIYNNKVIGYIYYSDIYDRIEINYFYILEEYRSFGYGKKLLKYLIDNNKKNITLEVNENNIVAINIYKLFGFKQVATRENYYGKNNGLLLERRY